MTNTYAAEQLNATRGRERKSHWRYCLQPRCKSSSLALDSYAGSRVKQMKTSMQQFTINQPKDLLQDAISTN